MKLKLEIQDGYTILSVKEDVLAKHAPVLKTALLKLIQSGKRAIILDFTEITQFDLPSLRDVAALEYINPELNAQVVVASLMKGVGHASSREEAIKIIGSPLANLLATEARLQAHLFRLEKHKAEIQAKLAALSTNKKDLKSVHNRNSELKSQINRLEKQIKLLIKNRTQSVAIKVEERRLESLGRTVVTILEQDGVLPLT